MDINLPEILRITTTLPINVHLCFLQTLTEHLICSGPGNIILNKT